MTVTIRELTSFAYSLEAQHASVERAVCFRVDQLVDSYPSIMTLLSFSNFLIEDTVICFEKAVSRSGRRPNADA